MKTIKKLQLEINQMDNDGRRYYNVGKFLAAIEKWAEVRKLREKLNALVEMTQIDVRKL